MRGIVCAAALIFIACALNASAVSVRTIGHLTIEMDERSGGGSHGYASYRIRIQNRSTHETHRIKVRLEDTYPSSPSSNVGRLKGVSKTIEAAPNATVETYIYQPYLRLIGDVHGPAVWVDGKRAGGRGGHSGYRHGDQHGSSASSSDQTIVTTGAVVAVDGMSGLFPASTSGPGFIPLDKLEPVPFIYSGLDGILLTLSEAEALSGATRDALWDYVKSGGSLAVTGDGKLPDEWKRLDKRLESSALNSGAVDRYEIGFGQLFLTSRLYNPVSSRFPKRRPIFHGEIYDSWKETQQTWMKTYTSKGANAVLPVAETYNAKANYRRMFYLMLLLAVLIGPVNIFLFRKIDRRMKLFWTVPAVSLLACVLVVFYAAIADGGKRMRVCSLTYLDQGAGSATTIGWIGFYSPSAHPDGLLFDEETELTLQARPKDNWITVYGSGFKTGVPFTITFSSGTTAKPTTGSTTTGTTWTTTIRPKPTAPTSGTTTMPVVTTPLTKRSPPRITASPPVGFLSSTTLVHAFDADEHAVGSIDWTDGQRWSGEWIKPRMPLHFKFRKTEERNERIELKRSGGKLKVVNRLGAGVKAFWYADHDGKLYQASNIRNGADAVLTETKGVQMGGKTLRQLYISQDWVPEIEAAQKSPAAYLQPGRYIAELEENIFVEKAMKGAKMKPSTFLVVGGM